MEQATHVVTSGNVLCEFCVTMTSNKNLDVSMDNLEGDEELGDVFTEADGLGDGHKGTVKGTNGESDPAGKEFVRSSGQRASFFFWYDDWKRSKFPFENNDLQIILVQSVTETGNDCDVSGCTPVDQQSCLQTESLQGLIISTKPRLFFVTTSVQLSSAIFTQPDPKPSTTTDVTGLTWPRENMWHFLAARRRFEMENSTFSNHRIKEKN